MSETILISIICSIFAALLTYFITTLTQRKAIAETMKAVIKQHEEVYHKDELVTHVKKAIIEHKATCEGSIQIKKIEKIVLAIYAQNGGKIETLDI